MLYQAPETENIVRDDDARERISIDDLLVRTFPSRASSEPIIAPVWRAPSVDSGDAQRTAIHALLSLPKAEIIKRNAASISYLEAQLADGAYASPAEIKNANQEWNEHKRRIDANRVEMGEQPVYGPVATSRK